MTLNSGLLIIVGTALQEVFRMVGASLYRIFSGQPRYQFERDLTDALRELLQRLVSRSRLMNPALP